MQLRSDVRGVLPLDHPSLELCAVLRNASALWSP